MSPCVLNIRKNCALSGSQCTVVPGDCQSQVSPTVCRHLSFELFKTIVYCQLWRLDGKSWLSGSLGTLGRLGTSVPQPMTADAFWCASQFCSLDAQTIPHSCSTRTDSFLSVCAGAAVSNEVDKSDGSCCNLWYIAACSVHCNVKYEMYYF